MANKKQRKKQTKKYGAGNTIYQFPVGEKTFAEYQRQVRNTKAKINRVRKNYDIDLENDIPIPSLESFESRKQFNEWVRNVESFRNRSNQNYQFEKNEYGVSASKSRLKRIEEKVKKAQQLADEQISKYEDTPFVSGGVEQGTVGLQRPNKTGIYRPEDFIFEEVRSPQRLDEIEEGMTKKSMPQYYDERMERMKENFLVALEGSFNSLADELIDAIKKIPAEDFYQIYLEFDEFDFDYFDTEGQMVTADETSIGQMMKYIKRYENDQINKDLWHKNFS